MKKGIILLFAIIACTYNSLKAQAACPIIVKTTFRIITSGVNPCLRTVSFDFINPTSGNKRINLTITVSGVTVINTCIDATGMIGIQRNYTSSPFIVCSLSELEIAITPYTGNDCLGPCAPPIKSIGGSPLPVLFASFDASRSNANTVQLKWATVTETNNKGFSLERMTNGNSWEPVVFVNSQASEGNSNSKLNYQYTDLNNIKGITQYRIKQTDLDGNYKYSEIRAVQGEKQDARTVVFPTPSTDGNVTVLFADAASRDISLLDMTGRTLKQWKAYQNNSLAINSLTSGMYSVRTLNQATGLATTEKIIINAR
ncbi:MAG: T9SS type A sorting domain-containing protein [Bacteroidota bacterium]|nr:T9SS type A sorting domain-containing protein [Bacteroidota bacterium]